MDLFCAVGIGYAYADVSHVRTASMLRANPSPIVREAFPKFDGRVCLRTGSTATAVVAQSLKDR